MRKDSAKFALTRILVNDSDKAIDILSSNDYLFEINKVIAIDLENKPGALSGIVEKIGKEDINISYIYGTVSPSDSNCLFVFCPDDIELAANIFRKKK